MTSNARSPARSTRVVALLAALLGLVWVWSVPPFMGPDEPWHLEYAEHVASGHWPTGDGRYTPAMLETLAPSPAQVAGRFPSAPREAIESRQQQLLAALARSGWWARVDWAEDPGVAVSFDLIHPGISAAPQPPAYYLLLGGWLALFPFEDPSLRVRFARLPSVAALVVVALAALNLGRALGGERAGQLAAAVALAAPPAGRLASTVSNDALAAAIVAAASWAAVHALRTRSIRAWAALAACLAAAPMVKSTAVTALALLAAPLLAADGRLLQRLRRSAPIALGVSALGLAGAWWVLRDSPVVPANVGAAVERLRSGLGPDTWRPVLGNLMGSSNWDARTPPGWILLLPLCVALGSLAGALAGPRTRAGEARGRRVATLLALLTAAQVAVVVLRGVGSARYLMPAWPALAALLGAGWARLPGRADPAPKGGREEQLPHDRRGDLPVAVLGGLLICWHASALLGGPWLEERWLLGR